MILGDMGAEVIKIEPPTPSPFAGGVPSPKGEEGRKEVAYFALNRNKKSIGLNLRSEAGQKVFYHL
jgi:formyl-CoA transferase